MAKKESKIEQESGLELLVNQLLGDVKVNQKTLKIFLKKKDITEDSVKESYEFARSIGMTNEDLGYHVRLFELGYDEFQNRNQNLIELGLSQEQIIANPRLFRFRTGTINRKYKFLFQLISQYIQNADEFILNNSYILESSDNKAEGNVEFLNIVRINIYENPEFFSTTVNSKEEKLDWMLRNFFDYENEPEEAEEILYSVIRKKPSLLSYSLENLRMTKIKQEIEGHIENAYEERKNLETQLDEGINRKRLRRRKEKVSRTDLRAREFFMSLDNLTKSGMYRSKIPIEHVLLDAGYIPKMKSNDKNDLTFYYVLKMLEDPFVYDDEKYFIVENKGLSYKSSHVYYAPRTLLGHVISLSDNKRGIKITPIE